MKKQTSLDFNSPSRIKSLTYPGNECCTLTATEEIELNFCPWNWAGEGAEPYVEIVKNGEITCVINWRHIESIETYSAEELG